MMQNTHTFAIVYAVNHEVCGVDTGQGALPEPPSRPPYFLSKSLHADVL